MASGVPEVCRGGAIGRIREASVSQMRALCGAASRTSGRREHAYQRTKEHLRRLFRRVPPGGKHSSRRLWVERVVSQGSEAHVQSLPKSSFRVRTRLRRQRSSIRARHPIAQGCRASPARSRPASMAIRRAIATASTSKHRPTWHLASSRCCAGDGPEFLADRWRQ